MEYGKQMFIDEYALDKFSHFTEYIFCSTLYSFFEDILTKFVFELSGNKCFKDNIRSKNQMHGNEKYMSSIKINLKQPNESKYKNRDDYLQALSRYNVTINRHLPDPFNVEYHKFYFLIL